jgi:hypothetical protein
MPDQFSSEKIEMCLTRLLTWPLMVRSRKAENGFTLHPIAKNCSTEGAGSA